MHGTTNIYATDGQIIGFITCCWKHVYTIHFIFLRLTKLHILLILFGMWPYLIKIINYGIYINYMQSV